MTLLFSAEGSGVRVCQSAMPKKRYFHVLEDINRVIPGCMAYGGVRYVAHGRGVMAAVD